MIGGVRTAFRMPEVHSIGLGGGSRVQEVAGRTSVGPTSVGFKLGTESQCFGGEVMTATDIAVARGQLNSITPQWDAGPPSQDVIDKASQNIRKQLQNGVDKMKTSDLPVVLLLVGGGSVIQMDDLEGVAECIRPPFYDVANAVGAAIAKVSSQRSGGQGTNSDSMNRYREKPTRFKSRQGERTRKFRKHCPRKPSRWRPEMGRSLTRSKSWMLPSCRCST